MIELIKRLHREHTLAPDEFRTLLTGCTPEMLEDICGEAREVAQESFGNRIYIRGLIEIGNGCRNDCYYCGIRRSNRLVKRYRLDNDTVLECCRKGYALGFRTFVLQGGEESEAADEAMAELIKRIREEFADAAITLSLGEKPAESYERFFGPEQTGTCSATKRTIRSITGHCIPKACRSPTGSAVWTT